MFLLRFLNTVPEPRLSSWACFGCHTSCAWVRYTWTFSWCTVDSAQPVWVTGKGRGISQWWRKLVDSKLLFTDKFMSISKYKLFSFTWEIPNVIFNSLSCLYLSLSPTPSVSLLGALPVQFRDFVEVLSKNKERTYPVLYVWSAQTFPDAPLPLPFFFERRRGGRIEINSVKVFLLRTIFKKYKLCKAKWQLGLVTKAYINLVNCEDVETNIKILGKR